MNHQTTELLRVLTVVLHEGRTAAMAAGEENLARVLDAMTETTVALALSRPPVTGMNFEDIRNYYY
jgi:hypothetical protein